MKDKRVAVVFITHTSDLNDYEKISVERCFSVFKNRDIILVMPDGMDYKIYSDMAKSVGKDFEVRILHKEWLSSIFTYNKLLIQPWFYELFSDYEYILTYQLDVYPLYDNLDYFISLGYDYCTSAFYYNDDNWKGVCLCGGFSLRRVDVFIDNLKTRPDWEFANNLSGNDVIPEDVFFVCYKDGIKNICPKEIGDKFCFDSYFLTQEFFDTYGSDDNIEEYPMAVHEYGKDGYKFGADILVDKYNSSKIVLCTVSDDNYFYFTYPMIKSFINQNHWIHSCNFEINIICDNEICKFSDENLEILRSIDPYVKINKRVADYEKYKEILDKFTPLVYYPGYLKCFYKFECLNIPDAKKVFFFDSDMLFVDSAKDLFFNENEIILSYDNFEMMNDEFDDYKSGPVSTGVFGFTINEKTNKYYTDLFLAALSMPVFDNSIFTGQFPEQHVFRYYFQNFTNIKLLPRRYNFVDVYKKTIIEDIGFMDILSNGIVAIHLYAKDDKLLKDRELYKLFDFYKRKGD